MSLLLFNNKGLIKNGLVALYDPYLDTAGRNILPSGSENFVTGWSAFSGATITVTPGQLDPDGGNNAYRIQSTGGSNVYKLSILTNGLVNPHNSVISINVKVNSGNFRLGNINGYTSTLKTTSIWERIIIYPTNIVSVNEYLGLSTASIGDSLDILVYQPQINLSQLYPYALPSGLPQSLTDRSGKSNNAQLGSTSGADTNDPSWTGNGLSFATDDYCVANGLRDSLKGRTECTVMMVINETSVVSYAPFLGSSVNTNIGHSVLIRQEAGQKPSLLVSDGSNSDYIVANEVLGSTPALISMRFAGSKKIDIKTNNLTWKTKATTIANINPTPTGNMWIGRNDTIALTGNELYLVAWNRMLSDNECLQEYKRIQKLMSQRGITI